ncbi:hypothetical protein H0E87_002190 [Populus deltoides]|uniref:Uncharacterized protein n=1 Tax=Populus deltoides TaxID=3696 RepID=A0A8T2ZU16_POPDE|nr:hypothetical protein H0E87_002190 [Populus deltoides]
MRYLFALSSNRSNKNFKRPAPVVLYCQSTSYVISVKPSGIVLINRVRDWNSDPSSSKLWHQATVLAGTTAETMAQSSKTLLPTPTLIVKLQSLRAHAISAQISVAASFYHVLCHAISVLILEV